MASSTLMRKKTKKSMTTKPTMYKNPKSHLNGFSNGPSSNPWSMNPWTMNNNSPWSGNFSPSAMNGTSNPYLVDSVNRVFEELTRSWDVEGRPWTPRCDFWETGTGYTIRCYVPGCTKSDCKIECTTGSITVTGSCNLTSCPPNCNCYCCECQTGSFSRYFTLPNPIGTDSVKASCKNGVLTVTCRKSSKSKPTTVKIG